jgi:hypothetical protein
MSINSTHADLKEEEIVHQLKDDMDIGQHNSPPSTVGQDKALNYPVFH